MGKPCAFVLGNHEPWHRELGAKRAAARRAAARQGSTLLNDTEATLAGVCFVSGILWAHGRLGGQDAAPGQVTGEMVRVAKVGGRTRLITNGNEARLHAKTRRLIESGAGQF